MADSLASSSVGNSIKVIARFRPANRIELKEGGSASIIKSVGQDTCEIETSDFSGRFTFDRVFDSNSRQSEVFEYSIKSTVDDILNGYNGTVFAYGQTGAGKSYTMTGPDIDAEESKGINPRIVERIFSSILSSPSNIEYTVRVSYMEIYMERIRDLLEPQNDNLPIHEDKNRGVYVKGLTEAYVSTVAEVFEVMRAGAAARATAATNMNQESSRSHAIFVIVIGQRNLETGSSKTGQLFLVDLAGSEKINKTGASGQTLEEAKKINKSLSTLGMVINSLTDGKSSHVPYRDSKLTRILQESLGGNSRTSLIIACSPSPYNAIETLSTLRFGVRAKRIKNKAKVNSELSPDELKQQLKAKKAQLQDLLLYIPRLENELSQWRAGAGPSSDLWVALRNNNNNNNTTISPLGLKPPSSAGDEDDTGSTDSPWSRNGVVASKFLTIEEREELQEQVREKDIQIESLQEALREAEKSFISGGVGNDADLEDMRLQMEKIMYEAKEKEISVDSLQDANKDLLSQLSKVKEELMEARLKLSGSSDVDSSSLSSGSAKSFVSTGEIQQDRKREKMRKMFESLKDASGLEDSVFKDISMLVENLSDSTSNVQAKMTLQSKIKIAERNFLTMKKIVCNREEDFTLLSSYCDEYNDNDKSNKSGRFEELCQRMERKSQEVENLRIEIAQLESNIGLRTSSSGGDNGIEFEAMKTSLMRELQNRCERVVELELSLEDTRERYNNVMKNNNMKHQQKRLQFLERNLEQLTHVQRQLIEQNTVLKKEIAIAERKLATRNERIESLEAVLQISHERLASESQNFETRLNALKQRLDEARAYRNATANMVSLASANNNQQQQQLLSTPVSPPHHQRIVKPLRGGATTPKLMLGRDLQSTDNNNNNNNIASVGSLSPARWFKRT